MSQLYTAREVCHWDKERVWGLADGPLTLVLDDGQIETTARATIFSYYLWVFHRKFPRTPLLQRHHLGNRQVEKGMELKLLGAGLFDCKDTYGTAVDMEELSLIAYQTVNEVYNDFTTRLKAYVSTITILDFVEAMEHTEIKRANDTAEPTQLSIDHAYHTIRDTLMKEGELPGNTIARMAKSGLVSMGQIQQCIGPRGFLTDIDSNIFRRPVLTGYTYGMHTLYDSLVESRSASKALEFAKDPVAESEYFNREMQLVASTLARLHRTDCGSKEYILFRVRSGDLKKIAGKYHLLDDGSYEAVKESDRQLIGKVIRMRSVLKCQHPDSYGVCSVCFGELALSIPHQTNLGHVCVTVMCEKISQNVLSTKHLDGSSKVDDFEVSEYDRRYIRAGTDVSIQKKALREEVESSTVIKLAERLAGMKVWLTLAETQAANLSDIDYHDVNKLSPSNVTQLTEVNITVEESDEVRETVTVPVSMGARHSWLTAEALEYIKERGYKLSERGSYVIDLTGWDVDLPLFQLPLKHTDMVQYMKTIKSFIMAAGEPARSKTAKTLRDYPTVDRGLVEFYNLISSKLTVNIAHLETIILSAMIRSESEMDHRLPRPIVEGELGSYRRNMELRSLGAAMAYERQAKRLTDIRSFTVKKRPDSVFDSLLMPFPTCNPRE